MKEEKGCTCCGKCCMNMRPYITIGTRTDDGSIPCLCTLTKELFQARISDQEMHMIHNLNFMFRYPKACPFLAPDAEGTFSCLVYQNRPGHCRNFKCWDKKKQDE